MKKLPVLAAAWLIVGALPLTQSAVQNDKSAATADIQKQASSFLDHLNKRAFADAIKGFDATMAKVLPVEELGKTWDVQLQRYGSFQKQLGSRVQKAGKYDVVHVRCQFEKEVVDTRVVFDAEKKIAGLFFWPDYQPPDYVRRQAFQESAVTVGSGDWALPGTLTLPVGNGPFPALVLVHGSGPQDRDESIGPNRPFRDLAEGLASRGIAVLRYDKRTRVHAAKLKPALKDFTVKEEVLDDALAAVALLRKTPKIDAHGIFVLGHSLGAICAPRLASLDPKIAGLICMAGTTRPFADVLLEQLDYVLTAGPHSDEEKKKIDQLREQAAALKAPKLDPSKLPFGLTPAYLSSLQECDPVAVVQKIKQPLLILQGERDYQATMADFEGWKRATAGRDNVTAKSYANLNHLFMAGQGKARPAEYDLPGHVDRVVIDDIADWVKKAVIGH